MTVARLVRSPVMPVSLASGLMLSAGIVAGGRWRFAALGVSLVPLVAALVSSHRIRATFRPALLTVEIPLLLLLFGALTFRVRSAGDLADNPLDAAGLIRIAAQGSAVLLAGLALAFPPAVRTEPLRSRGFRLYVAYAFVAAAGIFTSVLPSLTAYRVAEVFAVLIVFAGARHSAGSDAMQRIEALIYWWFVFLLGLVWVNVALVPSAVLHVNSPLKYQIESVTPAIAANSVGAISVILALWSLGRLVSAREAHWPSSRTTGAVLAFSLITLTASQYRTGYVALAAGLVVLFVVKRSKVFFGLALVVGLVSVIGSAPANAEAGRFLLRGASPDVALQLHGRMTWWKLAIPVWKESPIIGKGLVTATRFEVLAKNGFGDTSTIHSTWIEALVGTGVLGAVLLAMALSLAWRRALFQAFRRGGLIVPVLLLVALTTRSITGGSFERLQYALPLFLWVLLSLPDRPKVNRSERRAT